MLGVQIRCETSLEFSGTDAMLTIAAPEGVNVDDFTYVKFVAYAYNSTGQPCTAKTAVFSPALPIARLHDLQSGMWGKNPSYFVWNDDAYIGAYPFTSGVTISGNVLSIVFSSRFLSTNTDTPVIVSFTTSSMSWTDFDFDEDFDIESESDTAAFCAQVDNPSNYGSYSIEITSISITRLI